MLADNRCVAEAALRVEESKDSFSLRLLQIVATESYSYTTRLASALCFKNFIKRNWTVGGYWPRIDGMDLTSCQDADGKHKLPPQEVAAIKHELIGLMIAAPSGVQAQLGEAISLIAESDFFRQWDTLMDVWMSL